MTQGILIDQADTKIKENAYWLEPIAKGVRIQVSVPDITFAPHIARAHGMAADQHLWAPHVFHNSIKEMLDLDFTFQQDQRTPCLTIETDFNYNGKITEARIFHSMLHVRQSLNLGEQVASEPRMQFWQESMQHILRQNIDFTVTRKWLARQDNNPATVMTTLARHGAAWIANHQNVASILTHTVPLRHILPLDQILDTPQRHTINHEAGAYINLTLRKKNKHIGFSAPLRKLDHYLNLWQLASTITKTSHPNPIPLRHIRKIRDQENFANAWHALAQNNPSAQLQKDQMPSNGMPTRDFEEWLEDCGDQPAIDPVTVAYQATHLAVIAPPQDTADLVMAYPARDHKAWRILRQIVRDQQRNPSDPSRAQPS